MKKLHIAAAVENIPTVTAFIDKELEALNCPLKIQYQIDVAIDELFSNIAHYAYTTKSGMVSVFFEMLEEPRCVVITLIDKGKPFNPLSMKEPDISLPAEKRAAGGLGILMVKKTMDEIKYEYREGQNILRIIKKFK